MKPLLPTLLLLLALTGSAQAPYRTGRRPARAVRAAGRSTAAPTVYVCTGPYARKWHRKLTCAGGNCSAAVRTLSLPDARLRYDGPCGRCCR